MKPRSKKDHVAESFQRWTRHPLFKESKKGRSLKGLTILVSNDDGVYASGLRVLVEALRETGAKVVAVAPLEERSTMGHSLTLHKPLRVSQVDEHLFGINGSPADCVYIGMREVLKKAPDLVISGPNRGANLGQDVYYSGTVSAAREACILGIPSVAISVDVAHLGPAKKKGKELVVRYDTASQMVVELVSRLNMKYFPRGTLLNANVPNIDFSALKGARFTRQGFRFYSGSIIKRVDHRGRPYFWVGGQYKGFQNEEGTDCEAVASGFASVTPIQLDCTNHFALEELLSHTAPWE